MAFAYPYDSYFTAIFQPALAEAGYDAQRADSIPHPGSVPDDIEKWIRCCDIVLAEISAQNGNVFYELGLAHAEGKPTIIVSRRQNKIPFDLRHRRIIFYDCRVAGWERELRGNIVAAASALRRNGHELGN